MVTFTGRPERAWKRLLTCHPFGRGGRLVEARTVNQTAAFVFMIGDRFFGTVMVFVPGRTAGDYEFTRSLAVQVFKDLQPVLQPLMNR